MHTPSQQTQPTAHTSICTVPLQTAAWDVLAVCHMLDGHAAEWCCAAGSGYLTFATASRATCCTGPQHAQRHSTRRHRTYETCEACSEMLLQCQQQYSFSTQPGLEPLSE